MREPFYLFLRSQVRLKSTKQARGIARPKMKIGLLEYSQSLTDQPHLITGSKARRLVHDLKVAAYISPRLIQLTVAHSWSVVKTWLAITREQRLRVESRESETRDQLKQEKARIAFPDGAMHGFSRWPCADLRS